jgi:hypothetical protein
MTVAGALVPRLIVMVACGYRAPSAKSELMHASLTRAKKNDPHKLIDIGLLNARSSIELTEIRIRRAA